MTKLPKTQEYINTVFSEKNTEQAIEQAAQLAYQAIMANEDISVHDITDAIINIFTSSEAVKTYRRMMEELLKLNDEELRDAIKVLAYRQAEQAQTVQNKLTIRIQQLLDNNLNPDFN